MEVTNMSIRKKYYLKQKLWGVLSIILGFISVPVLDGDVTFALWLVGGGLVLLFTKEMLLDDKYSREVEKRGLKMKDYH